MKRTSLSLKTLEKEIIRLKKLAFTDELTGLYNRHGFREIAGAFIGEVARAKHHPNPRTSVIIKDFSIILFDLDHFKKVNDTYGHDAGDKVLKEFSSILLRRVRSLDVVARWGGEEILVGLVGATEEDAFRIAEEARRLFGERHFRLKRKTVRFTVSGGVASMAHAKDFNDLFKRADKALYAAKHGGRNLVCSADSAISR